MNKRKVQKEKTKNLILDETKNLLSMHGYQKVSTRMIAEKCQISQGTIFVHFISKKHLLQEVMKREIDLFKSDLSKYVIIDSDEKEFLSDLIQVLIKHEDVLAVIYSDFSFFSDDIKKEANDLESYLKQLLFDHLSVSSNSKRNILDRFLLIDAFLGYIYIVLSEKTLQNKTSIIKQKRGRIVRLYKMLMED